MSEIAAGRTDDDRVDATQGAGARDPKMPWAVKVVAVLLLAFSAGGILDVVLGLFHDRLSVRFDVLITLPAGVGLLRSRRAGLTTAKAILWIFGILGGLGLFMSISSVAPLYLTGRGAERLLRVPSSAAAAGFLAFSLLSWWMLSCLEGSNVRKFFAARPAVPAQLGRRGWRLVVIAAMLALVWVTGGEYLHYKAAPLDMHRTDARPDGVGSVSYGYRFKNLAYAVFESVPAGETLTPSVRASAHRPWIELPDGKVFELPGDAQLYEIRNGRLHTSDERVTREQFERFMASNPQEYTIARMLEFARVSAEQP